MSSLEYFWWANVKSKYNYVCIHGRLSKLWSLFGSPKLGPVLGPVLKIGTQKGTIILTIPHMIVWVSRRSLIRMAPNSEPVAIPVHLFLTQRVHVPNNKVLGIWVIGIIVQVLGKYMIIGYLDP